MVVDRFFIWVAEATVAQKLDAVDALVDAYFDPRLSAEDRDAVEAALTLVADDPDIEVRHRLAEELAEEDEAPRHLLLALLDDHPSVAVPIAVRSEALIDAELVDLVAHGGPDLQHAVAHRRRIGPTVAVALAEAGHRAACIVLLGNAGAEIPAIALERVVERFGEFSDLRQALLARPHVPITVRHRVLEKLSEAIENLVVVKSWMNDERAGAVTREAKDKATVALAAHAGAAEMVVLVEHLRRTGQLTTRLLLRAACVGNLRFVEEALSSLAGVPSARVAALVADGRESALRALYRRSAMPDRAFPAFHAAIEVHRELLSETGGFDGRPGDQARFSRRLVERVLTRFTAFERRDADDLLVMLRRFAADAARDHVKNVMAERMADATRVLEPPREVATTTEEATEPAVVSASVAPSVVDALALDAVAAELGVALGEDFTIGEEEAVPASVVNEPARADFFDFGDLAAPATAVDDMADDVVEGLFAHVRLEDLPPDWRLDEIAPEDLFGDDEIPYRRAVTPELRLVATEAADVAGAAAVDSEVVDEFDAPISAPAAIEAAGAESVVAGEIETAEVAVLGPEPIAATEATTARAPEAAGEPVDPFLIELESSLGAIFGDGRKPIVGSTWGLRGAA